MDKEKATILIVDDEAINISLLVNTLQKDYKVKAANNGQKALDIVHSDQKPDMILLDIMMPEMSGYEVIRELKSTDYAKDIPVIFISAMSEAEDETKGFEMGAADFITKPIRPSIVKARVATHLSLYQHQEELEELVEQKTIELKNKIHDLEIAQQAKSNFLASVSHEIRTPMNAILGFVDKLVKGETDLERKKYFNIIQNSGKSLLGIINDILNFSKIESRSIKMNPVTYVIKDLFDEICEVYKDRFLKKNITLSCDLASSLPDTIMLDTLHFNQVLANLIDNALKFTLKGGNVLLKVSFDKQSDQLHFSITDTGVGIAKENYEKIFHIFEQEDNSTTRKYGGVGLGLAIASNLIELLGGKLQLESEVGKGSRFFFSIPVTVCETSKDNVDSDIENNVVTNFNAHVLIVEDNKTNQMLMKMMLDDFGITYDIADDGAIAVEKFSSANYDCILMDENMPNINGIKAAKQIREIEQLDQRKVTPIVAVTANSLSGDRERFIDAGMDDYVSKPYTEEDIARVLKKYL